MLTEWAKETDNIIKQIISILDPQDLPYKTYRDYIKEVLDIPENKAKQIYDSIPLTEEGNEGFYGSRPDERKQKRGRCEVVSTLGYHYTFVALYTIESNRSAAYDELLIERYIPDENFCATIYGVYYKKYKAPPIDDDFETLAKRIISRLDDDESEKRWILGGSIEDDAVACYRIIPKKAYDSPYYRFADKGSLVFVGNDGLEYVFTAEDTSGSDYMMEYSLKVECEATGLCRQLYSESYCAR